MCRWELRNIQGKQNVSKKLNQNFLTHSPIPQSNKFMVEMIQLKFSLLFQQKKKFYWIFLLASRLNFNVNVGKTFVFILQSTKKKYSTLEIEFSIWTYFVCNLPASFGSMVEMRNVNWINWARNESIKTTNIFHSKTEIKSISTHINDEEQEQEGQS